MTVNSYIGGKMVTRQGRNKVWDQRSKAKNGVGSGITASGSGSTSRGIGISITVRRSRIRLSDITTKTTTFSNAPYWRNLPTFFNSVVFLL